MSFSTFLNGSSSSTSALYPLVNDKSISASGSLVDLRALMPGPQIWHSIWWCIIFLMTSLSLVYISTWILFSFQRRSRDGVRVPPMLPYTAPFLGHALTLFINPVKALRRISQSIGPRVVHGLKVIGFDVYFIYGPKNVAILRKYPTTITTPGVTTFVLKTLFGMAPKAVDMYTSDDSGIYTNPRPSSVQPNNRIDHLTHANFHKHLLGERLADIYQGFATSLMRRIPSLDIREEWTSFPDLLDFWLPPMTEAMNEALAGPILECVNPEFTNNLLKYYPYLHSLMKGVPSWLIPEAHKLQESLIRDVATWHAIARLRFQESDIDTATGRDPWWGSAFMRERQNLLSQVDNWDVHSLAASDFGIFWGSSVNIHPMALWSVIEVFRDKHLLCRVRKELERVNFQGVAKDSDVERLTNSPLLQSIYNELLRLRVEVQTIFSSDKEDIHVNEWRIPKGSLIVVPAGDAHRDPNVWNTRNGRYPLDRFWADRFLAYPGDPRSGPRKPTHSKSDVAGAPSNDFQSLQPRFVFSGLADSYMPFGIGERTCPGRGFARREIIMFCAFVVDRYDIELVLGDRDYATSTTFYGIGTQRPKDKVPFKIRKRLRVPGD